MRHLCFALFLATLGTAAHAQYNTKGTVRLGIGLSFAGHGTRYEQKVLGITATDEDGAATFTLPIQGQYAFSDRFTLGLFLEPGSYLDDTESRFNNLGLFGLEPRFYLMNKDRFAWTASLQLGGAALRIHDEEGNVDYDWTWRGGFAALKTGVGFLVTEHFGIEASLRLMSANFELKEAEVEGNTIDPTCTRPPCGHVA